MTSSNTSTALLQLEQLSVGYGKKVVLSDCSASLSKGMVVALIGVNGSGKSTLLKAITFGDAILKGECRIDGRSVRQLSAAQRAGLIAMVTPPPVIEGYMRVKDFVAIGRYPYLGNRGILSPNDKRVVAETIRICSLLGYEERFYSTLSDGERQRVLIARALAQETPIILLDEPTAHLDLLYRTRLFALLKRLAHTSGRLILLSTHELDLAMEYADRLWLINEKGTLLSGMPEELAYKGILQEVFHSESEFLDSKTRRIQTACEQKLRPIQLISSEQEALYWTIQMLQRIGYNATQEECGMQLHITKGIDEAIEWQLIADGCSMSFVSMELLAKHLRT